MDWTKILVLAYFVYCVVSYVYRAGKISAGEKKVFSGTDGVAVYLLSAFFAALLFYYVFVAVP